MKIAVVSFECSPANDREISFPNKQRYCDKHGYDFIIPDSDFNDEWNEHQLFEVFKLPNLKNRGRVDAQYVQENQFHFNQELFDTCPDNVSVYGFFQTEKYFSNIGVVKI